MRRALMTDSDPKPKRRLWRWLAASLLCLIGVGVVSAWMASSELHRKARLIELGASKTDVVTILGPPDLKQSLPFKRETGKLPLPSTTAGTREPDDFKPAPTRCRSVAFATSKLHCAPMHCNARRWRCSLLKRRVGLVYGQLHATQYPLFRRAARPLVRGCGPGQTQVGRLGPTEDRRGTRS